MSFVFKNKQNKEQVHANSFHDKMAAGIVQKCVMAQTRWADYMQRKTERFSLRAKKYGLILFSLLSVGSSFYIVMRSLHSNGRQDLIASPISIPVHSTEAADERTRRDLILTQAEYGRIEEFRHYMDSLGQSPQGLVIQDSILSHRPGLMDSIRVIEKLYELQTLKK